MKNTIEIATRIRAAIKENNPILTEMLLTENPELLQINTPFGTWLHVAADFGSLEITRLLIKKGIKINQRGGTYGGNALNEAASTGRADVVSFLLENGAEIDTSEPERNPLFSAIYGGHIEIVKILINAGINKDIKYSGASMKNMGALEFSIERGRHEISELLNKANQRHTP